MRNKLISLSVFFCILSFLIITLAYNHEWYYENAKINDKQSKNATNNLINYFKYQEEMNSQWSNKEKNHMNDVRNLYLINLMVFIITSIINVYLFFRKKLMAKNVKYYFLSLALILPIFGFVFNYIFHPLLFRNNDWIFFYHEISTKIFPQSFFVNSLIYIIILGIMLSVLTDKINSHFM